MEDLLQMRNSIEMLSKESQLEIFKIFKENDVEFSENKNGVFINMSLITPDVLTKIKSHMVYINKQETIINEFENKKHDVEEEYFT
jgi:uncharacterized membrane-anchored protein